MGLSKVPFTVIRKAALSANYEPEHQVHNSLTVPPRVSQASRLRLCFLFPPSAVCISTLGIFTLISAVVRSTHSSAITDAGACRIFLAPEEQQSVDGHIRSNEHIKPGSDHRFLCLDISWKFSGGCTRQEENHWIHPVIQYSLPNIF